jgi:nicotinamide riboside transporter PnuC
MNIIIETFGIITTILAVVGVVLNNRMDRKCFWFWIVSNAISCALHIHVGLWSLVVRDAVFLVLAFDGLAKWKSRKYEITD